MKIPIVNNIVFKLEKKRNEKWFENYYAQQKNDKISDIVPHGAFLIFFPAWIVNEEIAFPSNTFMYLEEDFLKKYCDRLKYKIIYIPELKVKHLEGRSVSAISKKELIKYQFKLKNVTISLKKYIKFLKEKR